MRRTTSRFDTTRSTLRIGYIPSAFRDLVLSNVELNVVNQAWSKCVVGVAGVGLEDTPAAMLVLLPSYRGKQSRGTSEK